MKSCYVVMCDNSGIAEEVRSPKAPVEARYDAAQSTGMNAQHWAATDSYDADAAHSLAVRTTLVKRSRYEFANNGHAKGIQRTHANYVVGRGPKLRIQGRLGKEIEAAWNRWAGKVHLARKLRTAAKAKVQDGEAFLWAKNNPTLADLVTLDLVAIECDQVSTPYLGIAERNHIDGIRFDDWGNPLYYDVLTQHPGSSYYTGATQLATQVPARFMFHLFSEERPGQHRAVPECSSTLNLFAVGRRFREATVVAAENIANFSILIQTPAAPNTEPDAARPFSTMPIEKGMMTALPYGGMMAQPKPEQPASTYDAFVRQQVCEEARPLSMPYNIAAADSSGYSFSGGRLDHTTYFVAVDVEQSEIEEAILDPLFTLWFAEARLRYGWVWSEDDPPARTWDWPTKPQIDDQKTAGARKTTLSFGGASLSRIYAEDGLDYDEELEVMADNYGVTVEELKQKLYAVNLGGSTPSPPQQEPTDQGDEEPDEDTADEDPEETPEEADPDDDTPPAKAAGTNGHRLKGLLR